MYTNALMFDYKPPYSTAAATLLAVTSSFMAQILPKCLAKCSIFFVSCICFRLTAFSDKLCA